MQTPLVNHWWNVPSTSPLGDERLPPSLQDRIFEIEFDSSITNFWSMRDGASKTLRLRPQSVADFYGVMMTRVVSWEWKYRSGPRRWKTRSIRFEDDTVHASYDAEYANRVWRALVKRTSVLKEFRSRFIGKVSPVHFFWGVFDMAVTRFSGGRPERPARLHDA